MRISVIIPAYNEEQYIAATIKKIKECALHAENLQLIVADGGSTDETIKQADQLGVNVIHVAQKRRSVQMNEGAKRADGEIIYFLHADTHPPLHFDQLIKEWFLKGYKAGCFQLSFDTDHPLLQFYAWWTRFDMDVFRFGDQSLFVEKKIFKKLGGFNENYDLLEGHEMVGKIKRSHAFRIGSQKVITSSRTYLKNGIFRLECIYIFIFLLYKLGLAQPKLKVVYQKLVH